MIQISESIYLEADFLLTSFLCGALMILAYDFFRIFREVADHGTLAMAVEDLLYWLGCSAAVFYLLYEKNNGILRVFFILGVIAGMFCYNHFVSPYIVKGIVWILKKIIWLVHRILYIFHRPMVSMKRKTGVFLSFLRDKVKKLFRFLKKRLKKAYKVFKIGMCKL